MRAPPANALSPEVYHPVSAQMTPQMHELLDTIQKLEDDGHMDQEAFRQINAQVPKIHAAVKAAVGEHLHLYHADCVKYISDVVAEQHAGGLVMGQFAQAS